MSTKRLALSSVFCTCACLAMLSMSAVADELQPNIVFILADDMTYTDAGCYSNADVRTPNIDRLAQQGLRFNHAYSAVAMCSPMRQMIYSGQFPVRNGAYPQRSRIRDGIKTLPVYFKELGYRVAIAGKQHYAPEKAYPFEVLSGVPLDFSGFREFVERDPDQPFCLMVCSTQPHTPWDAGDASSFDGDSLTLPGYIADTPRTRELFRHYYAEIEHLDSQVGKVMSLLDDTQKSDDTLLMFASEQGAAMPFAKWTLYDAGMRAQLIARWPGKIEKGSVTDAMVQYCDLLPTWIEAAGETPPELDGKSFLGVLKGQATQHRDVVFGVHTTVQVNNGAPYPIRAARDKQFKLIWNLMPNSKFQNNITETDREWFFFNSWREAQATNKQAQALVARYQRRPEYELYDTLADPDELKNLANSAEHQASLSSLRKKLETWMKSQGDKGIETELNAPERSGVFKKDKK